MGSSLKRLFPKKHHVTEQMLGKQSIMFRWRSSLWKLIWKELLIYIITFILISIIYRLALPEDHREEFEKVVRWCIKHHTGLPLTFLLGFYVSLIVKRWWEQYTKLPWPDSIAYLLRAVVIEKDKDQARLIRKRVIRYCLLSYVLCMRRLSMTLLHRFPTVKDVVKAKLLTEAEAKRIGFEDHQERFSSRWWVPLKWNSEIIHRALTDGIITSASGYTNLIVFMGNFRTALNEVETYGHVPVPLVYSQVVTMAVYVYFGISLIADQVLIGEEGVHIWFPLFLSLKFLFYFGWLKVAETLYNPFGDDDEDFGINELLDRHAKVTMEVVEDEEEHPAIEQDEFTGEFNRPDTVGVTKGGEGAEVVELGLQGEKEPMIDAK